MGKKQVVVNSFESLGGQKGQSSGGKREPLNIVKAIFGNKSLSSKRRKMVQNKPMTSLEQEKAAGDAERLAKLRQQKNYLERIDIDRKKIEAELRQKENVDEEEKKDENKIIQLQEQKEKDETLQKKGIKKMQGTREMGPRPKF